MSVAAEYVDARTLRATAPNLADAFVEGTAVVEVSLLAPRLASGGGAAGDDARVWTADGVELEFAGSTPIEGIELTGGGLGGAVVGKPCRIAAATFDAQGRPRRLGGEPLSIVCRVLTAEDDPDSEAAATAAAAAAARRGGVVRPARLDVFHVAEARVGGAARGARLPEWQVRAGVRRRERRPLRADDPARVGGGAAGGGGRCGGRVN